MADPAPKPDVHEAARTGDLDALGAALATGADINARDKHRRSPLHLAAWAGHLVRHNFVGLGYSMLAGAAAFLAVSASVVHANTVAVQPPHAPSRCLCSLY